MFPRILTTVLLLGVLISGTLVPGLCAATCARMHASSALQNSSHPLPASSRTEHHHGCGTTFSPVSEGDHFQAKQCASGCDHLVRSFVASMIPQPGTGVLITISSVSVHKTFSVEAREPDPTPPDNQSLSPAAILRV